MVEIVRRPARRKHDWTAQRYDRLRSLHADGLAVPEMAARLTATHDEVRRALARLGLAIPVPPPPPPKPRPVQIKVQEQAGRPPAFRPNPLETARQVLGRRMTEGENGFTLDRVPCTLDTLIREVSRLLKEAGQPQLVGSPRWVVTG